MGYAALISLFGFYSCTTRSTHPHQNVQKHSQGLSWRVGASKAGGGAWESVSHLGLWGPPWPGREMISYWLPASLLGFHQLTIVLPNVIFTVTSFYFFIFGLHHVTRGILIPRPRIEPVPHAVEARSPNHWTAREVL